MTDLDGWLDRVYGAETSEQNRRIYDEWAETYDADVMSGGYGYVPMAAGLFGRHVAPGDGAVLDAGCGSGLVGEALFRLGYTNIVGIDLSQGMLDVAGRRGTYRELRRRVLGEPLDFADGTFRAVVCTGVFTPGHAPPEALDELVRVTGPGGVLVFCCTRAALDGGGFGAAVARLDAAGVWTHAETAGPVVALPGAGLRHEADFFVYRR